MEIWVCRVFILIFECISYVYCRNLNTGVGKTCILLRYSDGEFAESKQATIGVDHRDKIVNVDGNDIRLQLWDTAGQERFGDVTTSFYRHAEIAIVVYDVTDRDSFECVDNWLSGIDRFSDSPMNKVIVGNKSDKDNRVVTEEEAKAKADSKGIPHYVVSAKDNIGIDAIFLDAAKAAYERLSKDDAFLKQPSGNIKLDRHSANHKKCQC